MVLTRPLAAMTTLLAAMLTASCLGTTPPRGLPNATPLTLVIELEGADGHAAPVPEAVVSELATVLAARNLQARPVSIDVLGDARTTDQRLAAVVHGSDTPCVMLIEARARFFSQIAGRYRWDVEVRTSFVAHDRMDFTQKSDLSVAAFLLFEHEGEPEALAFVRRQLGDDIGALVDRALATHSPR